MKKITKCFLYGLLILLWAGGFFGVMDSLSKESYVSMRNVSITKEMFSEAVKQEKEALPFTVTLWEAEKGMKVSGKETGKNAEVTVLYVYGNMAAVLPVTFRFGNSVLSTEGNGCVIDEKTAYQLFGAVDVLGTKVVWDQEEYEVKGVVSGYDEVLMIPSGYNNKQYSNMEFLFDQKSKKMFPELKSMVVSDFLQRYSFVVNTPVDGELGWQITASLYFFPLLLFTFFCCYRSVMCCLQIEYKWIRRGMGILIFAGISFVLGRGCGYHFWIPNEWIPGRWSDFKFYVDLFQQVNDGLQDLRESELMAKDIYLEQGMFRGGLYGGILLLCSILVLLWERACGKNAE